MKQQTNGVNLFLTISIIPYWNNNVSNKGAIKITKINSSYKEPKFLKPFRSFSSKITSDTKENIIEKRKFKITAKKTILILLILIV